MREKDIEAKWTAYVKRLEGRAAMRKYTSPGRAGVPDRLLVCSPDGFTVYIEAKRPGETPTRNQWKEIATIRGLGGHAYVSDTAEQGVRLIGLYASGHRYRYPVSEFYSDSDKLRKSADEFGFGYLFDNNR